MPGSPFNADCGLLSAPFHPFINLVLRQVSWRCRKVDLSIEGGCIGKIYVNYMHRPYVKFIPSSSFSKLSRKLFVRTTQK